VDGRLLTTLKGDRIVAEFIAILEDYVAAKYAGSNEPVTVASSKR
jgi:(E)-4-hydroxy-3-methylbut-2-enyl-diphosphate synthase